MSDNAPLIHPTAVIDPSATLAADVRVGAFSLIGAEVAIGAGSVIGALLGSALASFLGQVLPAESLLLVAASGFGLSTLAAAWLGRFAASLPRADGAVGLAGPAPPGRGPAGPAPCCAAGQSGPRPPPRPRAGMPPPTCLLFEPGLQRRVHFLRRDAISVVQGGQCAGVQEGVGQGKHAELRRHDAFTHEEAGHCFA